MSCRLVFVVLVMFGANVVGPSTAAHAADGSDAPVPDEMNVEQKLDALLDQAEEEPPSFSSDPNSWVDESAARQAIVDLGPACLPHLFDRISRAPGEKRYPLLLVAAAILRIDPAEAWGGTDTLQEWLESKIRTGHADAEREFLRLSKEWLDLKQKAENLDLWHDVTVLDTEFEVLRTRRELTPLGRVYARIEALGIFVLPALMRSLEEGRYDFLPIIDSLTGGQAPADRGSPEKSARACTEWWTQNEALYTNLPSLIESSSSDDE